MVAGLLLVFGLSAKSQSFSEGKSLYQLREAVSGQATLSRLGAHLPKIRVIGQTAWSRQTEPLPAVFLPRWEAERLPFFCRIEHHLAKGSAVPFKFRLGSVEYVDWLEGKGD